MQRHIFSVGVTPIYDPAFVESASKAVRLAMGAAFVQAGGAVPQSYRDNAGVVAWVKSLTEDTTPPATVASA